jgi:predicted LPLAT superfamily acyltransferase
VSAGEPRSPVAESSSSDGRWAQIAEIGTVRGLRFAAWFHRTFGPGPSRLAIVPASIYYALRNSAARRGSLRYLRRVAATPEGRASLGGRPGFRQVVRHFTRFSLTLYDRVRVWGGDLDSIDLEHDGSDQIFALAEKGRGALLLGAHLGSLDLLGFIAKRHDLVMNVVAWFDNAERINRFLESQGPEQVRMIHLDPASVWAAFEIRACLARGEFVVVLADRFAPPGLARAQVRTGHVDFLGRSARFPMGPFLLAGVLGCPVYLALCLRVGPDRYRTLMRPLAPAGRVPRGEREKHAQELLARYAGLLERTCLEHPLQWFNFYDFWEEESP